MENLINRIRNLIQYVPEKEIFEGLQKEGLDRGTIFLAYCAAVRMDKDK